MSAMAGGSVDAVTHGTGCPQAYGGVQRARPFRFASNGDGALSKLTKRAIDATKPGAREAFLWDDELRGFGLRVKPSGVKTYVVQYRTETGRTRRLAIGQVGRLTPASARKEARELLGKVDKGKDTSAERKVARMAPDVGRLMDRYLSEHVKRHNRASTEAEVNRLIEKTYQARDGFAQDFRNYPPRCAEVSRQSRGDAAPSEPCAGNTEQGLQSSGGLGASARRREPLPPCEEISRDKAGAISLRR